MLGKFSAVESLHHPLEGDYFLNLCCAGNSPEMICKMFPVSRSKTATWPGLKDPESILTGQIYVVRSHPSQGLIFLKDLGIFPPIVLSK